MKVRTVRLVGRVFSRAGLAATILAASLVSAPLQAGAITRDQVIDRAKVWVKKKVPYSQRKHYRGYRQDCSGFVSMAWKLKRPLTSRTISSRAKRISISSLKPGDAVWKPGHVSIFGGWKNKKKRQYYALEQTTWGSTARKRARTIPRNGKAYRRPGIESSAKVSKKPTAKPTTPITSTAGAVATAEIVEALQPAPVTSASLASMTRAARPSLSTP